MPELATPGATLMLLVLLGYLLGSIPFGLLLARAFGLGDLRRIGSGNIGATNVLRTGSRPAAALTVLLDGGKGALAVLLARALGGAEDAAQLAGLAALLGHLFPVWLGFRGGKGVATFLGLMLALAWPLGLAACALWLLAAVVGRRSSAAALVAVSAVPLLALPLSRGQVLGLALLLAALVWWRHRDNLARLLAGTEPKIGAGRP